MSDDDFDLYDTGDTKDYSLDMEDSFAQSFFTTKNQKESKSTAPTSNDTPSDGDRDSDRMDADERPDPAHNKPPRRDPRAPSPDHSPARPARRPSPVRMNSTERSPRHRRPDGEEGEGSRSIYIGQLPWWTTDTQLEGLISQYGRIKDIKYYDNKTNGKLGYVMVEFDDVDTAAQVLDALQGREINAVMPLISYANAQSGRFAPQRQAPNRQGRRDQNSPYPQTRSDDRAGSRSRDHRGGGNRPNHNPRRERSRDRYTSFDSAAREEGGKQRESSSHRDREHGGGGKYGGYGAARNSPARSRHDDRGGSSHRSSSHRDGNSQRYNRDRANGGRDSQYNDDRRHRGGGGDDRGSNYSRSQGNSAPRRR